MRHGREKKNARMMMRGISHRDSQTVNFWFAMIFAPAIKI
jgi:hypothetical protein